VNVAFTARDAKGALVDGLTENDVEVYEDGVQQKLAYFKKSADAPLTLGTDRGHKRKPGKEAKRHQHDIEIFLKNVLGPKDRAFLVCFENRVRLVSDFSQSGAELMERWKNSAGSNQTARKTKKKRRRKRKEFPGSWTDEKRVLGTAFYDSIFYSVSEKLAQETGRRALLVSAMAKKFQFT